MQRLTKIFLIIISLSILITSVNTQINYQEIELIIPTFLGNWQRNYYGNEAPSKLKTIWRTYLGKGKTVISKKIGEKEWAGTGWTGQPLIVKENNNLYLIIGCYDHHLKKINAHTGKIVWQYLFDDVIKGTGTIWENNNAVVHKDKYVILQGSRRGLKNDLYSKIVPSYRGISYLTGEELWRMNSTHTASYSRDVDGSAIVLNDTAFIGLENGLFTVFSPDPQKVQKQSPAIYQQLQLYTNKDVRRHGGNLVVESSPAKLGDHIYITTGSGHVYGYNLKTRKIDWDFYIGSDMDGSPVVTNDSCLIVTVEKQYINGQGGVFKLNPFKKPQEAVVWYFPVKDDSLLSWAGGVIGSAGINDVTRSSASKYLCAFVGIDGYLNVVNHKITESADSLVSGPNIKHKYRTPKLIYQKKIGPSISTPIFVGNKLIVAGYHGIYLFQVDDSGKISLLSHRKASAFESTPVVYDKKIFIGSRDGYLYCFGE